MPHSLEELARAVDGTVHGNPLRAIAGVNGLSDAREGELSFYNSVKYKDALRDTKASALLVNESALPLVEGRDVILVGDPYLAFAKASAVFHPRKQHQPGIDPRAVIEDGALIDPTATVMPFCYISRGAKIGARSVLYPNVFVGEDASLGADALVYPGVVIRERCVIGERAIIHAGAVIGADGFGFAFDMANSAHFKIPQAGIVELEDDVELGANSAVDRATLGVTRIGRGSKLDNLVQIGHNATIGPLCIICGQTGVAGSSEIGTLCVLGGQVGVTDHLKIADGCRFSAQSGVMGDIRESGDYAGAPARKFKNWLKASASYWRGPDVIRDLARLKKQVEELAEKLDAATRK